MDHSLNAIRKSAQICFFYKRLCLFNNSYFFDSFLTVKIELNSQFAKGKLSTVEYGPLLAMRSHHWMIIQFLDRFF